MSRFLRLILLLTFCLLCSGCCKLELNIDIAKAKTYTSRFDFQIDKDVLQKNGYTIEELVEEMASSGIDIGEYEEIGSEDQAGFSAKIEYPSVSLTTGKNTTQVNIINPISLYQITTDAFNPGNSDFSFYEDLGFHAYIRIHAPGEIKAYSQGELESPDTLLVNILENTDPISLSYSSYTPLRYFIFVFLFLSLFFTYSIRSAQKRLQKK